MRDLSRARQAAKKDLQGKRQQISSLMLRLGRHYPGKKTWGPAHMNWLMAQKLEHREQRIVSKSCSRECARRASGWSVWSRRSARRCPNGRLPRSSGPCRRCAGSISLPPLRYWPRSAISPAFENPRQLMGYLGLVPSESSTGDKVKRGGITKAGNGRARRMLVEAAWGYRYLPRVSREKQTKSRPYQGACARSLGKRKPDCAGASVH